MNKTIVKSSLILAFSCVMAISFCAYANPCQPIAQACMKEGFVKGGPEGKRLIKDCVEPVVAKSKTLSMSFTDAELDACKAMLAEKMQGE